MEFLEFDSGGFLISEIVVVVLFKLELAWYQGRC
jgi:hypothetical protein